MSNIKSIGYKKYITALSVILCGVLFASLGNNMGNYLMQYSYSGTALHVEIVKTRNDTETYILYETYKRLENKVNYFLVRIDNKNKVTSTEISDLANIKNIKFGNISFTEREVVVSVVFDGKIKLLVFSGNKLANRVEDVSYDKSANLVYFLDNKLYIVDSISNVAELNIYDYEIGKGLKKDNSFRYIFESALDIDDLYFENDIIYAIGDFLTKESIEKKLVIINKQKISYTSIGNANRNISKYLGHLKDNKRYMVVMEGVPRRVANYFIAEIDINKNEIVNKYSFEGVFPWVNIKMWDRDKIYSFETQTKSAEGVYEYSLYCRDIFENKRKKINIDNQKFKQFYNEIYLTRSKNGVLMIMVYDEVRGRVAKNVISVIKMSPITELCR